jgi:GxxExxY protein
MADLTFKDESYKIVGSCFSVHKKLGSGFLESVYQEALEKQFIKDGIPYIREKKLRIQFDDILLDKFFKSDFVCFEEIIVELKATPMIYKRDEEQLLNYLKATNLKLGILVCFGSRSLTYKRLIN